MGIWNGFALATLVAQGGYELISVDVTRPEPNLSRTEVVVQQGDDPLNQISITRVSSRRGSSCHGHQATPLILLSPFLLPGEFYEVSDTPFYKDSLVGRLARHRDVWLVDQRRTGLQAGECESGNTDCSGMVEWDVNASVDDALLATSLAGLFSSAKPAIGGFSAGSSSALATVNRAPELYSGVFLYEGTLYTEDPDIAAHNTSACATLKGDIASGAVYDPSAAIFGAVIGLAATDPDGLFPLPGFPPGITNQQAMLGVFSAPPPPGALSPTSNFVRMIADFSTEQFIYSNQDRLTAVGPMFDNYAQRPALRDLACGLSGEDTSHVDNLDAFEGDVLMYIAGTGFGQAMLDTAGLFTNAESLSINERPELGDADFYFHDDWKNVFYKPLRDWLKTVR